MSVSLDRKLYGLVEGERELIEASQENRCAICTRPPKRVRLNVDHCHKCVKWAKSASVRGLLCVNCNRGLFREDPALLRKAADYFARHACPPRPAKRSRPAITTPNIPAQEATNGGPAKRTPRLR